MNDEAIRAAHDAEQDELEEALAADDHWDCNGTGEVLWITERNRVLHSRLGNNDA